jgi:AraC-like DNA-binding protein
MSPRYAGRVGSIVCGHATLDIWMVIQTDELPRDEVLAAGFEPVPAEMSDEEVRERYGVKEIYRVTDHKEEDSKLPRFSSNPSSFGEKFWTLLKPIVASAEWVAFCLSASLLNMETWTRDRLLERVAEYVADACAHGAAPRAKELAAEIGLSRAEFSSLFSNVVGQKLGSYLRRKQVERALELLAGTALLVSRVADLCGFRTRSTFFRAFARLTGMTPSEYRNHQTPASFTAGPDRPTKQTSAGQRDHRVHTSPRSRGR